MNFQKLAEYFDKIEKTASRLEMIEIVSQLFKETPSQEIKKVIYLCQSQLGASFESIDIGLGEKFIEEAIAKSSGYTREQINKLYKEKGDLGLVAEELIKTKKQASLFKETLSIQKVFQNYEKIAKMEGKGSQELKIKLMSELLNSATPLEAKYIARIPLGNLRLGTGDPTLMDALADLFVKEAEKDSNLVREVENEVKASKEKKPEEFKEEFYKKIRAKIREKIEEKYNIHSNLGAIAEKLKEKGLQGLNEIKITAGIPIRPTLAERLNSAEEIIEKIGKCLVESKYDGFRIQVHKNGEEVTIYSRQSENMTHMFPEIIKAVKEQINAKTAILEGETLAVNLETNEFYSFQVTITRKRKYGISEASKDLPLKLFLFDVMMVNEKDLMNESLQERREILQKIVKPGKIIELTNGIITDDAKKINEFFEQSIEQGLEGIIAKDLNAKYIAGARKFAWIKLKRSYKGELQDSIDAVIIGFFKGRGKRTQFGIGALLVAIYDDVSDSFKSIAKIGTGLSEQQLQEFEKILNKIKNSKKPPRVDSLLEPDEWVQPKYVIEVRADEITISPTHTCAKKDGKGLALRFPRMISIREKKPEEATTEAEIISMYKKQKTFTIE